MWKDYVSLKELKKDLVFKRIVEWSESELILEDGTKMEVVCSESDCCAWAEGEFKNVKLDAVITDIKILIKVTVSIMVTDIPLMLKSLFIIIVMRSLKQNAQRMMGMAATIIVFVL